MCIAHFLNTEKNYTVEDVPKFDREKRVEKEGTSKTETH